MSILNDTTPRFTRHLSDHHAVQGEAEYVERHAPEIGRDAPAMAQVRALKWRSAGYDRQILEASALGLEVFYRVHGKPGDWTLTSPGAQEYVHTPGYETRADAQAAAQADYERRIIAALSSTGEKG